MIELAVSVAEQSWVNRKYRRGLRTHPIGAPVLRISEVIVNEQHSYIGIPLVQMG
jgi:hypothetical protein